MASTDLEIGPAGRRVAANLAALRKERGLKQSELAARMSDLGRPMSAPVISKTEKLDRRTDVDDLVALAVALGTTPNRLLLADPSRCPGGIDLTPAQARVEIRHAWEWATGELPLTLPIHATPRWDRQHTDTREYAPTVDGQMMKMEEELRQFNQENHPHTDESGAADISAAMRKLDNHPEIMKQAIALVRTANRDGMPGTNVLIAAIDLADFIVKNSIDKDNEHFGATAGEREALATPQASDGKAD